MNKKLLILAVIVAFLVTFSGCAKVSVVTNDPGPKVIEINVPNNTEKPKVENPPVVEKPPVVASDAIPAKVDWPVTFGTQAPTKNWSLPYQEACEEAALINADKYFKKEKLTYPIMNTEILNLVDWERTTFGYYTDTSLTQVKQMAEDYFGLNVEISQDLTVNNIKKQLTNGYLVLIPTAGRLIANPYYSGKGPLYHFLVIRGYNDTEFITNDVGLYTKGDGYKYTYTTIINAIHDLPLNADGTYFRPFDAKDMPDAEVASKMLTGEKQFLIVKGVK